MFEEFTTASNGASATIDILVILAVTFILGWIARWIYEAIVYPDMWYEEYLDSLDMERKEVNQSITTEEQEGVSQSGATDEPTESAQKEAPAREQNSAVASDIQMTPVVMPYKQDDLKMVEGIGPKIEQLLQEGGITTWKKLAETDPDDIKTLLRAAGERYRIHDPTTWPEQAALAVEHKWAELDEYQDALSGGKDLTRIYKNSK